MPLQDPAATSWTSEQLPADELLPRLQEHAEQEPVQEESTDAEVQQIEAALHALSANNGLEADSVKEATARSKPAEDDEVFSQEAATHVEESQAEQDASGIEQQTAARQIGDSQDKLLQQWPWKWPGNFNLQDAMKCFSWKPLASRTTALQHEQPVKAAAEAAATEQGSKAASESLAARLRLPSAEDKALHFSLHRSHGRLWVSTAETAAISEGRLLHSGEQAQGKAAANFTVLSSCTDRTEQPEIVAEKDAQCISEVREEEATSAEAQEMQEEAAAPSPDQPGDGSAPERVEREGQIEAAADAQQPPPEDSAIQLLKTDVPSMQESVIGSRAAMAQEQAAEVLAAQEVTDDSSSAEAKRQQAADQEQLCAAADLPPTEPSPADDAGYWLIDPFH